MSFSDLRRLRPLEPYGWVVLIPACLGDFAESEDGSSNTACLNFKGILEWQLGEAENM